METLINIDVPKLEPAIRFYEEGVGLTLHRRLFGGTVAEMLGASSRIYLLQKAEGTAPVTHSNAVRCYERHWTPLHLDFVVNDIEAAITNAIKAGATLETTTQSFSWGQLVTMRDPFGHGLCFLQWSGGG